MNQTYDSVRSVGKIRDWRECIQMNSMHLIALLLSTAAATTTRRRSESAYICQVHNNVVTYTSTRLHIHLPSNVHALHVCSRCLSTIMTSSLYGVQWQVWVAPPYESEQTYGTKYTDWQCNSFRFCHLLCKRILLYVLFITFLLLSFKIKIVQVVGHAFKNL